MSAPSAVLARVAAQQDSPELRAGFDVSRGPTGAPDARSAVRRGRIFFRPGDPADRAFHITEGRVEIQSRPVRLAVLGPSDVFGEMSLIEEQPYRLLARALTPGKCSTLTCGEFEQGLLIDPTRPGAGST